MIDASPRVKMRLPSGKIFNRNFSLLMAGQSAAFLGSSLYSVVLILYLKQLTGSAKVLGAVESLALIPWVVIGPLAGTLVDRLDRKAVIMWSCLVRGMLMVVLFVVSQRLFSFAVGPFPLTVYVLLLVTFCFGIIDSALGAALNSIIPVLLPRDRIQKGNSVFQGLGGTMGMIGNAVGGIFFTFMGAALAFLVNGITYFFAAFTTGLISVHPRGPAGSEFSCKGFLLETKEGFRFILSNRGLRNQTIIYTASNLFFPMVIIALPFLVEDMMGLTGAYYGYLLSAMTLSSILTYVIFGSLGTSERQNYLIICAIFFIEAASFLALSFTLRLGLVFALFSLLSACMAISRLINTSLRQKMIPDKLRGRVFSTLDAINGALAPLSFAAGGFLIDLVDKKISVVFLTISAACGLLGILFAANRPIRVFYLNSGSASITDIIDR